MNYIYFGESGLLMRQTAESKAEELLATDKLEIHPDFLLVEPDENGLSIDRIDEIGDFISLEAAKADKKVILIDRIDVAVVAFQNAMLKFLEDNSNHVDFILTSEQRLLDTVMSRCVVHQMKRASREEMNRFISGNSLPYDAHAYAVASGRPVVYASLLNEEKSFLEEIRTFTKTFGKIGSDARQIFAELGLVKESGGGSFFDSHSKEEVLLFTEYVQNLFCSILYHEIGAGECAVPQEVLSFEQLRGVFSINSLFAVYERCMEDRRKMQKKGMYTKNDFFDFFRFVYGLTGKE